MGPYFMNLGLHTVLVLLGDSNVDDFQLFLKLNFITTLQLPKDKKLNGNGKKKKKPIFCLVCEFFFVMIPKADVYNKL